MSKKYIKQIIYMMLTLFFTMNLNSLSAIPVDVSTENRSFFLGKNLQILEDKDKNFTALNIISNPQIYDFHKPKNSVPNMGFTRSSYWFTADIYNSSGYKKERYLLIDYPALDNLEVNFFRKTRGKDISLIKKIESGRSHPLQERYIKNRNFIFPFKIGPHEHITLAVMAESDGAIIMPLRILTENTLHEHLQGENFLLGLYYGIIVIMFLYNLLIYLSTLDKNYLLYVFYIGSFGVFQFSMNGLSGIYLFSENPEKAARAIPFFIGITSFFAALFSINFLETKKLIPTFHKALVSLAGVALLFSTASIFMDYQFIIRLGQILPASMVLIAIPTAIICYQKGNRAARFYLTGWSILFIGIISSAMRVTGFFPHNFFTLYGLQIGSALELAFLSLALADRINLTDKEKRKAQQQLIKNQQDMMIKLNTSKLETERANNQLQASENKYRHLIEGSGDLIFTLDNNWKFKTANSAFFDKFLITEEKLEDLSFFDILYNSNRQNNIKENITEHKLNEFVVSKNPIEFTTQIISPLYTEPQDMKIRLEYIDSENSEEKEILGNASTVLEDSLQKYLNSENQEFTIGNYLVNLEEVTIRITRNLKKFLPNGTSKMIKIALREIILNSIEHGNLGITFEEKSKAQAENRYFELLKKRQTDTEHLGKKIKIAYSLNEKILKYTITDEGKGFDHKALMKKFNDIANENFLTHGRGISMALSIFDEINYNDKGNEVTLIKIIENSKKIVDKALQET